MVRSRSSFSGRASSGDACASASIRGRRWSSPETTRTRTPGLWWSRLNDPETLAADMAELFRIVGGDGKEYGPASIEEIRTWLDAGRADPDTLVREEGGTDWRKLGEVPELAAFLRPPAP